MGRKGAGGGGTADHESTPPCCDGAYVVASSYHGRSAGFLSQESDLTSLSLGMCAQSSLALDLTRSSV